MPTFRSATNVDISEIWPSELFSWNGNEISRERWSLSEEILFEQFYLNIYFQTASDERLFLSVQF